jgi:hypothetical protein
VSTLDEINRSRRIWAVCGAQTLRSRALPNTIVATRFGSTSTPSMRLDDTALSIRACSRRALSFCGACLVNSSCLPRNWATSARYHEVAAGMADACSKNCRNVIMRVLEK